jgi:hypothetical protein
MQPTYLPWSGYFGLMSNCNYFVFLDDVQFERRSWQSRNRILMNGEILTLTIPTKKQDRATLIKDIEIAFYQDWIKLHLKTIKVAYGRSPYFDDLINFLLSKYQEFKFEKLSNFTEYLIKSFAKVLELEVNFINSSDLNVSGVRTKYLVDICESISCDEYLAPIGSSEYLKRDNFNSISSKSLFIYEFKAIPYLQFRSNKFVSHLSIIDVIANIGFAGARDYITDGSKINRAA